MSYLQTRIAERMTADEIKHRARHWYDHQIATIAKAHGPSWPKHKDWIDDYLKEEIRQRLMDLGWRTRA